MALYACTTSRWGVACLALGLVTSVGAEEAGLVVYDSVGKGEFQFGGVIAARSEANIEGWLLPAPRANPGMLEMFRRRDRQPAPDLVPWAGEFVGKYLISAIQALRMSDDRRLEYAVRDTVHQLLSLQDEDGYLGPWPKEERLLGHWDLWGHYHIMLALLMWHERTGDPAALAASRRMADLVCDVYLDTGRRVLDAGAPEMNMAIIHSLGWLYRLTAEPRYLRMMRHIEADFGGAGDYFRMGLEGVEFYRTPRPRWESLHDIQGLVELYRITGDERYRQSFVNTWRSIAHRDIHPSGAFSTGEQAIGNPYGDGAIETCCTIAWVALSEDMLRLTGDPEVAEYLDLAFWNAILGAQHPTGRWWTYDTPMNGSRAASAHQIVFQARPGTPELNCCSVNGPRGLGMMTEWAIMVAQDEVVVNTYAPVRAALSLPGNRAVSLTVDSDYPVGGAVRITVDSDGSPLTLALRIPTWTVHPQVEVNGTPVDAEPGQYCRISRAWAALDTVDLTLDMNWRVWPGELGRSGTAAVYRGPLLMAFDAHYNEIDVPNLPPLDLDALAPEPAALDSSPLGPLTAYRLTATDGTAVTLVDYASAGAYGTPYAAWLPALHGSPAPFHLVRPLPGSTVPSAPVRFEWVGYPRAKGNTLYRIEVARDEAFTDLVASADGIAGPRVTLTDGLSAGGVYYWRVVASNEASDRVNEGGPWAFRVDPSLPPDPDAAVQELAVGPKGLLVGSDLAGSAAPDYGTLVEVRDVAPCQGPDGTATGALRFNGETSMVTYAVPSWPEENYSLSLWVRPGDCSEDRLHQIFSAWVRPMDDPLRVYLRQGTLAAGWEAYGQGAATPPIELAVGAWVHVAAVKEGGELILYVDGEEVGRTQAPPWVQSLATGFAIGGNPRYTGGNEHFRGDLARLAFYARALGPDEVTQAASLEGMLPTLSPPMGRAPSSSGLPSSE